MAHGRVLAINRVHGAIRKGLEGKAKRKSEAESSSWISSMNDKMYNLKYRRFNYDSCKKISTKLGSVNI